jgi:hypothetical protein
LTAYADTSFLFSLYFPDAHAAAAVAALRHIKLPMLTTDLVNSSSIMRSLGGFFKGIYELGTFKPCAFSTGAQSGVIHIVPIPAAAFARGRQMARSHTPGLGSRALEVLHVSSVLVLKADTLLTFDRSQAKLATVVGLTVV